MYILKIVLRSTPEMLDLGGDEFVVHIFQGLTKEHLQEMIDRDTGATDYTVTWLTPWGTLQDQTVAFPRKFAHHTQFSSLNDD